MTTTVHINRKPTAPAAKRMGDIEIGTYFFGDIGSEKGQLFGRAYDEGQHLSRGIRKANVFLVKNPRATWSLPLDYEVENYIPVEEMHITTSVSA